MNLPALPGCRMAAHPPQSQVAAETSWRRIESQRLQRPVDRAGQDLETAFPIGQAHPDHPQPPRRAERSQPPEPQLEGRLLPHCRTKGPGDVCHLLRRAGPQETQRDMDAAGFHPTHATRCQATAQVLLDPFQSRLPDRGHLQGHKQTPTGVRDGGFWALR